VNRTKLRDLLVRATQAGIQRPNAPSWVSGSELERLIVPFVSTDKTIEDELQSFVREESAFAIFDEQMFNQGNSWSRINLWSLLRWLLYTTLDSGVDTAIGSLEKFLASEFTPALEVLAVSGIEVDEPIALTPTLRLVPFSSLPASYTKHQLDPPLLKPENLRQLGLDPIALSPYQERRSPTAAITKQVKLSPKITGPKEDRRPYISSNLELYEACECLTLLSGCTPLPVAHWHIVEDWVPCARLLGSSSSSPVYDVINPFICKLSLEQRAEATVICQRFADLDQRVRDKLRIPIQRLNQARRRRNLADKSIDLGVSFESLYLNDRSHKEQTSFTFRLRAAWHLGTDKAERKGLTDFFNRIYDCRSIAVHTGTLNGKIKLKERGEFDTSSFLNEAEELCARSIKKIIESKDFPNWNNIILGS
jgi:hypothetical protein